jgi:hypothetical protein
MIAVKEFASDLQTFLGSKAIEEKVEKEDDYLMALFKDGCLQRHILLLVFRNFVYHVFDIC